MNFHNTSVAQVRQRYWDWVRKVLASVLILKPLKVKSILRTLGGISWFQCQQSDWQYVNNGLCLETPNIVLLYLEPNWLVYFDLYQIGWFNNIYCFLSIYDKSSILTNSFSIYLWYYAFQTGQLIQMNVFKGTTSHRELSP